MNNLLRNALYSLGFILLLAQMISCANIAAPTGGLKDTLPPVLLQTAPPEFARNVKEKKILLTFDEYIELDNIQQNLIVSPTLKSNPTVTRKLKEITVKISDTLDENTTYTFNFGKAIKDLNEGNPYKDFSYTFSTGNNIDSLTLEGKVIIAATGAADSTLLVLLHRSMDDSAVVKEKPRYYTRLDSSGNFKFTHLPPGTFRMYALKDESGMVRYLKTDQLFAFSDSVVTSGDTIRHTLYAYEEAQEPEKKTASKPNKQEKKDTLVRYQTSLENNLHDLLQPLVLTFPTPLATFDSTGLTLTDSSFLPVSNVLLTLDSTRTKLTLQYNWAAETVYHLQLQKNTFTDSAGLTIKTDTLQFETRPENFYGSLRLRFPDYEAGPTPMVLQFIQNKEVKFSIPINAKEYFQPRFIPGEYDIRILYDDNDNGKWDPGIFFTEKKIQPEKVLPFPKKLVVRANWENEHNIPLENL